jgi:hypothetical protein
MSGGDWQHKAGGWAGQEQKVKIHVARAAGKNYKVHGS